MLLFDVSPKYGEHFINIAAMGKAGRMERVPHAYCTLSGTSVIECAYKDVTGYMGFLRLQYVWNSMPGA